MNCIKEAVFVLFAVASIAIGIVIGCELNARINQATYVKPEVIHSQYTQYGRYWTDGTLITNDGNEWGYYTSEVSNVPVYDAMPVWVAFDDNGTPNDITDDVILGMVYDRCTAAMDVMEESLSTMDNITVTRNGNNIRLGVK